LRTIIYAADARGKLIRHLEDALAVADELNDGTTGYLIERALDWDTGTTFDQVLWQSVPSSAAKPASRALAV
jgi:hypothetical protein